jgi:hypothetical protein
MASCGRPWLENNKTFHVCVSWSSDLQGMNWFQSPQETEASLMMGNEIAQDGLIPRGDISP